jgi:hypothetical protein
MEASQLLHVQTAPVIEYSTSSLMQNWFKLPLKCIQGLTIRQTAQHGFRWKMARSGWPPHFSDRKGQKLYDHFKAALEHITPSIESYGTRYVDTNLALTGRSADMPMCTFSVWVSRRMCETMTPLKLCCMRRLRMSSPPSWWRNDHDRSQLCSLPSKARLDWPRRQTLDGLELRSVRCGLARLVPFNWIWANQDSRIWKVAILPNFHPDVFQVASNLFIMAGRYFCILNRIEISSQA